jgi:hypothetical protein
MTRQEKLDKILAHMTKNMADIPTRPDQICERAGLKVERAEAFLMLDMMHKDGYVIRNEGELVSYVAQYKGIIFLDNGGYSLEHRHYKRQKLAKKVSDYVDIIVKPIGIITAVSVSTWTIIQVLKFFGLLHACG